MGISSFSSRSGFAGLQRSIQQAAPWLKVNQAAVVDGPVLQF
jgi:hypothetical protein